MPSENPLLEISPFESDRGELVGRRPEDVPPKILAQNFTAQIPLKAIRAKCVDCCGGDKAEARKCVATSCPLWSFRMGSNPFRKKSALSEAERQKRAARLRVAGAKKSSGAALARRPEHSSPMPRKTQDEAL